MKIQADTTKAFVDFFNASYRDSTKGLQGENLANGFFNDFVSCIPQKINELDSYSLVGNFDCYYHNLADLKFMNEFSDGFNRYWHLLRAYSGALTKLKLNYTVKGTKNLYSYYFEKYGDRRILRNEHWFEQHRWEFLDELHEIFTETELNLFTRKYQFRLNESLKIYQSFLMQLIIDLKKKYTF